MSSSTLLIFSSPRVPILGLIDFAPVVRMACERKFNESEATTGFFLLLGQQGNKAVLDWVMKEGLIPSRYECPKCKKDMRLVERKGTIDGFEWRCRVQSKENPHFVCRSFDSARGSCQASCLSFVPRCVFFSDWITMDMSASRTDVASSIEVSDLFTLEPMSFDVMAATEYIENCTTCAESEDLCGILDEILFTLEDVDTEAQITPERLRLVNLVQWAALKCSRRSIRLQNAEFKKYIREVELSRRTPTAASPASQQKRPLAKRQPASPQKDVPSKKQAKSE
ncbi:uncharacterized protein TNCV_1398551 [Trichonephila clavipes]|nr:uncharacterized protein TNCV_1398551 [Trichonephila clavipes]